MNREWVEKDFYSILGVSSEASQDEIKRAYRKLAQQLHPDANPGDTTAEDRFKDVSEAYATLSDPEQRKEYDQVRRLASTGAFTGGGGGFGGQQFRVEDLSDLFGGGGLGDLFGGGRRRPTGAGPVRGADAAADLNIAFEEAVSGVTTSLQVRGQATCTHCGGSGAEPPSRALTCPTCGGSGSIAQNQGFFSFSEPCPQCRGSGRIIENPCTVCRGAGVEVRTRSIKVRIPAGVKDGSTIRLAGKGGPGRNGGPAGDLLVKVHVTPHPVFGRAGNDLTVTVPISFSEAALGTKLSVPTMNGAVRVKIPPGTKSGKVFRVRGKGVNAERGRAGDLLARVEIQVPGRLSKDEKRLLEQLASYDTDEMRAHLDPYLGGLADRDSASPGGS
ncbi:MAG TPA: molecular chaperone DnaJ [Acidimicrobiia bacterium]|nr:molecular chaperone DnaJ [Acidimicrobiia bacterium]